MKTRKSKTTKRSLTASITSVILCLILLIGATLAWFTDSVTSGRNRITAGNLDVELEYWDGSSWKTVTADTNLFQSADESLWEPGHTEYAQLRIRNAGTLALTYDFTVNVYGDENGGAEKEYTNKDGGKFKLSDYLVFSRNDGAASVTNREDLWLPAEEEAAAMGNPGALALSGTLLESGAEDEFTLAVYMPTSVGNAANQAADAAESEGAPEIYLGLTLNATQTPYESDSFGNDYDAAAAVTTEAELQEAVASGGNVILWNNIELTDRLAVASDTVLNLNGKTITYGGDYASAGANDDVTPIRVNAGGSLTITGNGTIDASAASDYVVPVSVMGEGGSILIENGTFIVDTPRESCVFAMGGSVTISGGTFINSCTDGYTYGDSAPLTLNVSNSNPGTISVTGGTFVGRDPAAGDDNLGGTFIAAGYQSTEVSEGRYVVTAEGVTPVDSADAMAEAVADGDTDTIALVGEITLDTQLTVDRELTIDGMGSAEISGRPIYVSADVTFKDVALAKPENSNNNATLIYGSDGCESLVFEGCTFSDPQWEAMQITSSDLKSLTVNNCIFTAADVKGAANSSYGNAADQAIRYIHIQPSASDNVVADITITNNTFKNCDKIKDSVVGIYYVDGSTITVGGNIFENLEAENGVSGKLSVGWPEEQELKRVANWTGGLKTFGINAD